MSLRPINVGRGFFEIAFGAVIAMTVAAGLHQYGIPVQLWSDTVKTIARLRPPLAASVKPRSQATIVETPTMPARTGVNEGSPFLAGIDSGQRYHPLIDIAGTQFNSTPPYFAEHDYFGFRNKRSAWFDPAPHRTIIITGNSEALGVTHITPIAEKLEAILRARVDHAFRVINLAANSVTTAHEINYFVNLGFNFHPEFVISHSFATDVQYGNEAPDELQYLGLFPLPFENAWARSIHGAALPPRAFDAFAPLNRRFLLDGVIRNIKRYKAIAGAAGAHFIWGLQKIDWRNTINSPAEARFKLVDELHIELTTRRRAELQGIDFIDFNDTFGLSMANADDPIHTDDGAAQRIAEIYAERIIATLPAGSAKPSALTVASAQFEALGQRLTGLASRSDTGAVVSAVTASGLKRKTAIEGGLDFLRSSDRGQYAAFGWAFDRSKIDDPMPLLIVAVSNHRMVFARETRYPRPDVQASVGAKPEAAGILGFSGMLRCDEGADIIFLAFTNNDEFAPLKTLKCE